MTMKEKFYMFLEKGFCPELEKGVEDPLYKYYGGQMKDSIPQGRSTLLHIKYDKLFYTIIFKVEAKNFFSCFTKPIAECSQH